MDKTRIKISRFLSEPEKTRQKTIKFTKSAVFGGHLAGVRTPPKCIRRHMLTNMDPEWIQ